MSRDRLRAGLVLGLAVALAALGLVGVDAPGAVRDGGTEAPLSWRGRFPNVLLQAQDGRSVRFYDDLVQGRTVLLNFMYIECEGTCPGVTSTLVEVGRELGSRVGRDVLLLCLTLQPRRDTPERLRDYARRYGAGPGLLFLSGRPEDLDLLRHALGFAATGAPRGEADWKQHTGLFRIGNDRLNCWTACPSLSTPAEICRRIRSLDGPPSASPAEPPEFPMGNPFGRSGASAARDAMALETLVGALDRLHQIGPTMELPQYQELLFSRISECLELNPAGAAALREALTRMSADCAEAAKPVERVRSRLQANEEDPRLLEEYRAAWQACLSARARAFRKLEAVLSPGPRPRLFRENAARWLFFLEGHAQER
jgi:protein SCO1/2